MKKSILSFVVVFLVSMIGFEIYKEIEKKELPHKAKRLPCMAKVISFEKAYDKNSIEKMQKSIKNGDIKIVSFIDKATYMDSTLFDTVHIDLLNKKIENLVVAYGAKKLDQNSKNTLEYTIFENDKKDPKKKSDSCKLYRGYIVMKFKNQNNKLIYQNQIDFMDNEGKDILQTLQCGLKAFMTYRQ